MKRILFVDDEPKVLEGLRRLLHSLRGEWQMSFAESGAQALEAMSESPFDVLVTDIRMPGMDGTELLAEVRERHPQVVRIILSGQADRDLTLRATATAHQYLSKPCDADAVKLTIARASALQQLVTEPSLQALAARAKSLPSVPALYTELVRQLESNDGSIQGVAKVIAGDPGMTAKVLQLANSAFFGSRRRIVEPGDAVRYLGFDTVKALALSVKVFSQFKKSSCPHFSVDALAQHSVRTGMLARAVAKEIGLTGQEVEDSFLAGLLHDVGKLLLADARPEQYSLALAAERAGKADVEGEREVFGTTHAEVGTYLLWLWGLPDPVVEAVAYHHAPARCPVQRPSPLTAVYLADALSYGAHGGERSAEMDLQYVGGLGLPSNFEHWEELAVIGMQEQAT